MHPCLHPTYARASLSPPQALCKARCRKDRNEAQEAILEALQPVCTPKKKKLQVIAYLHRQKLLSVTTGPRTWVVHRQQLHEELRTLSRRLIALWARGAYGAAETRGLVMRIAGLRSRARSYGRSAPARPPLLWDAVPVAELRALDLYLSRPAAEGLMEVCTVAPGPAPAPGGRNGGPRPAWRRRYVKEDVKGVGEVSGAGSHVGRMKASRAVPHGPGPRARARAVGGDLIPAPCAGGAAPPRRAAARDLEPGIGVRDVVVLVMEGPNASRRLRPGPAAAPDADAVAARGGGGGAAAWWWARGDYEGPPAPATPLDPAEEERRRWVRRDAAAATIQSGFRDHRARLERRARLRRHWAATAIQAAYRGHRARQRTAGWRLERCWAAGTIQAGYRRHLARTRAPRMRLSAAATVIQAGYRRRVARGRAKRMQAAAARIQALYRGHRERGRARCLRIQQSMEVAPIVQSGLRGLLDVKDSRRHRQRSLPSPAAGPGRRAAPSSPRRPGPATTPRRHSSSLVATPRRRTRSPAPSPRQPPVPAGGPQAGPQDKLQGLLRGAHCGASCRVRQRSPSRGSRTGLPRCLRADEPSPADPAPPL